SGSQKPTSTNWEMMEETELALGRYTAISKSGRSDLVYAGGWYVPSANSNGSPEVYLVKIIDNSTSSQKEDPFLNTEEMPSSAHIICIALDPEDDDHIIVVFSNYNIPSLYESHDGGITFTDIGGNLEENPDGTGNGPSIRWAEIIPTHAGQLVFVGTSVGLFSTENTDGANTTWVKESPEMIGKSVVTSLDYRSLDGRLVVGTHGNGTFEVNIEDFKTIEGPTNENAFVVSNVYPNPTSDIVKLDYELPEDGVVRADIFNSLGQLEKNLIWAPQYAGKNRITWDGTNSSGSYVRNGIYYCQIRFQDQKESKKVVLIR
ncbi:MAG: flagellar basal body rod modification protein, partial [Phycisphaeraceae bacterium]|nr:flagellar basal body rod modification protein [Phycisphaeraceae bacterium]